MSKVSSEVALAVDAVLDREPALAALCPARAGILSTLERIGAVNGSTLRAVRGDPALPQLCETLRVPFAFVSMLANELGVAPGGASGGGVGDVQALLSTIVPAWTAAQESQRETARQLAVFAKAQRRKSEAALRRLRVVRFNLLIKLFAGLY